MINKILLELWDFFKKNFAILAIGVIFLLLYPKGCNSSQPKDTHDTTTVTTQQPQPIVIMPPYQPTQSGQTIYIPLPGNAQGVIPASTMEGLIAQVKDLSTRIEQLGTQYYATKHYADSIELKDTAGLKVGVVQLKQTVSENTLQSTQPTYQLSFPHTITTITNTVYPKPKRQVYIGVGVESLLNSRTVQGVDLGLLFKDKKDNVFGLAGTYDIPSRSPGIQFSIYKKIHL